MFLILTLFNKNKFIKKVKLVHLFKIQLQNELSAVKQNLYNMYSYPNRY